MCHVLFSRLCNRTVSPCFSSSATTSSYFVLSPVIVKVWPPWSKSTVHNCTREDLQRATRNKLARAKPLTPILRIDHRGIDLILRKSRQLVFHVQHCTAKRSRIRQHNPARRIDVETSYHGNSRSLCGTAGQRWDDTFSVR